MTCRTRSLYRWMLLVLIIVLLLPELAMAAWVKLSGTMPATGDVTRFKISSDGQYVVYLADQDTDFVFELYSVPLAGPSTARVKLNRPLASDGDVIDFEISPDGSRVVVIEDVVTTGGSALKAIERCRTEQLVPVACLALVDREEGGREAIEAQGVPLQSLFRRGDFLP